MSGERICEGVRVIEIASMVSGPLAGQGLADLGAEVIKIEPLGGDPMRPFGARCGEFTSGFVHVNRGKKSIAIDLKAPDGQVVASRLCQSADVVLENCRPGVLERLGLGYDTLRHRNPKLIYASITGFGQTGPYKDQPAYDPVVQGAVGIMDAQAKEGIPQAIRNPFADKITGTMATSAILGALFFRERNNMQGQRINISMLDAFASFALPDLMLERTFESGPVELPPSADGYRPLQALDGWIISTIITDEQFQSACQVFGRTDMCEDVRFSTTRHRIENLELMWDAFESTARALTVSEILEAAQGKGFPIGPVNSLDKFMRDPQAVHNGTFVRSSDIQISLCQLKPAAEFSSGAGVTNRRAPLLGEHSDMVLKDLGFSCSEIEELRLHRIVA